MIRNNDIAISSETRPLPQEQKQQEPKLRLLNFVACKTVGEYNRNKRKKEKFCLAEKAQLAKTTGMGQSPKHTALKRNQTFKHHANERPQQTNQDPPPKHPNRECRRP